MTSLADKVALVKELDAKRTQGEWWQHEANQMYVTSSSRSIIPYATTYNDNGSDTYAFIAHAPQMAALITQLWDENQKQREVLGLARVSLNKAKRAINGREHTGFIDTALTAIDNVMKGE